MLLYLLIAALNIATAVSQNRSTADLCTTTILESPVPANYAIHFDTDNNFVYGPDSCTSTDQKFVTQNWYTFSCTPAIKTACASNQTGWSFAWYNEGGGTCQAAIYRPVQARGQAGAGILDSACCERNLQAAAKIFRTKLTNLSHYAQATNRASINVAGVDGAFPHTETLFGGGLQRNSQGTAVNSSLASYILQAVAPPYPYDSRNCTAQDLK